MTWLSHRPGAVSGQQSKNLAEELGRLIHIRGAARIAELNEKLRKAAHIVVFMVLTVLVLNTVHVYSGEIGAAGITAVGICIWAIIDEATKLLVIERHFSRLDLFLNIIGVGIGLIISLSVWKAY